MTAPDETPDPSAPAAHATTTGMTGGGFYNENSSPQWAATEAVLPLLEEAAADLPVSTGTGPVCLADFGCSEGRNSIAALSRPVSRLLDLTERPLQTIHSDLPTNDFSALLRALRPDGHSVFPGSNVYSSVVGGSMYDQLLPDRSLHLATTFNAIGFLSRKPVDTLPGYILPNGPSAVRNNGQVSSDDRAAFAKLAREDIAAFLKARAQELVPGGKLLLQVFGANETASTSDGIYDLLNDAVLSCVENGSIAQAVYEAYYQPVYMRTLEELTSPATDHELGVDGLFEINHNIAYEVPVPFNQRFAETGNVEAYARDYVNFFRAFTEAVLRNALPATDRRETLIDGIYSKAAELLKATPELYPFRYIAVAALMTRQSK